MIDPPPRDLADSLVAHWNFDEASGDIALDDSGSRRDGQLAGPTRISDGRFGGGLRFASDDAVSVPNFPAATANWSLSAWIRISPEQLEDNRVIGTILTTENFKSSGWELNVERESAQPMFVFSYWSPALGDYLHTECACVAMNAWLHLAAIVNSETNSVTLYVDGVERDQQPKVSDIVPGDPTLYFGRWNMDGRSLSADLDDIAIWGRALAASEIATLSLKTAR
ncbi:MAG: LamG domain-containing protein [Polyangiaceae bacterium]